jgi:hypothetical protein
MQAENTSRISALLPEEHRLAAEQQAARERQADASWNLQAAQFGLGIADFVAKTAASVNGQGLVKAAEDHGTRRKEIAASLLEQGIQPFEEADGVMRYRQPAEIEALDNEYVADVTKKYGKEAGERAQAYVDGLKTDDRYNAAQQLNKYNIDLIRANSDDAVNRAVEAGDFAVYEQWAATVAANDPMFAAKLVEAAKPAVAYGITLKEAEGVFDTEGLSAAQQLIDGTGYTDEQKAALSTAIAGYARGQTGRAENDAVNTFTKTMEATGGDITASVSAARAAAASVSGSMETKRAVEADISKAQSAALSDDFNKSFVAHQGNAAWLRQEADRLKAMKGGGDYEGQSGLWRSHISQLEGAADSLDAAKAARETAEARAAEKARIEAQESVSVLSDDVISAWAQGNYPEESFNSLADIILTSGNIRDKNVRIEDIHTRIKKVLGQEAPYIAGLFGRSEQWLKAQFSNMSKKDYIPTPKEIEEYEAAAKWAFATEMEIIGNAPFAALNADAGKMINRLNAALSSKDYGKIDPKNMVRTIQALENGILDDDVVMDPKAAAGYTGYVYPNTETKERYTRYGQEVANLLQSEGLITGAGDVAMRHFPEKDGNGSSYGAGGDVYFEDTKTGTKYRTTAKGKEIVIQRQDEEQNVLTGNWTDIPMQEQPKKTGFWEGFKEFFSLPAEPRR